MMPNPSGSTPPPRPWTARAAIITPMDGATAASRDPAASRARVITRARRRPIMSPKRPMIGVAIEALSRYAVTSQATELPDESRPSLMVESTGITSD